MIDLNLSLEGAENDIWGKPSFNSSVVINCRNARKIPMKDLTPENLRLLIGQKISLKYVIPLAIEMLEENIFCAGNFGTCDLLIQILKTDCGFWNENEELYYRMNEIMSEVSSAKENLEIALNLWNVKNM